MLTIPSLLKVRIESTCVLNGKINFMNSRVFPMGCCVPPRQFKSSENPLATLHKQGHISIAQLDDLLLQSRTYDHCVKNVTDTTFLLDKLDLVVHPEKSTFIPSQMLVILEFIINSLTMTIQLTTEKPLGLKTVCVEFLRATTLSIREVASAIGRMVASFHGVMHAPLFFRHLEKNKCLALEEAMPTSLSQQAKCELQWWCDHVITANNVISHVEPQH